MSVVNIFNILSLVFVVGVVGKFVYLYIFIYFEGFLSFDVYFKSNRISKDGIVLIWCMFFIIFSGLRLW